MTQIADGAGADIQSILSAALAGFTGQGTLGNGISRSASKTVTFTGGSGLGLSGTNTAWFTVTGGLVLIERISGRVTTSLTVAAGATATLGVTGSTALFIAATLGSALLTSAEIWMSTTPTAAGLAAPAACKDIVIDANVLSAIATNDITGGVIEMNVIWRPLTPGAVLAAA